MSQTELHAEPRKVLAPSPDSSSDRDVQSDPVVRRAMKAMQVVTERAAPKSGVVAMNLSPSLDRVYAALSKLPYAHRIQVFGSAVRSGATPNDLDVFIDLRGGDEDPESFGGLLRIARQHYGLLDPFVRTKSGLLVRSDDAAWWVKAKNARALGADMDRDGVPLFPAPEIALQRPAVPAAPRVVFHGSTSETPFDTFRVPAYFVASDIEAEAFADEVGAGFVRVIAATLALKNPMVLKDFGEFAEWDEDDVVTAIALGHDGAMLPSNGPGFADMFIAFRPDQINQIPEAGYVIEYDGEGSVVSRTAPRSKSSIGAQP